MHATTVIIQQFYSSMLHTSPTIFSSFFPEFCFAVELKSLFKVESWAASTSVILVITKTSLLDSLGCVWKCCSSRWNLQVWIGRWDKSNLLNQICLCIQVSILWRRMLCRSKNLSSVVYSYHCCEFAFY